MGYNPNILHLEVGYNPFTKHLLTSWDIQVLWGSIFFPPWSILVWNNPLILTMHLLTSCPGHPSSESILGFVLGETVDGKTITFKVLITTRMTWNGIYIYIYLEPKWPLFWLEFRPCFGGLTFKTRGQLGSRYMYICGPSVIALYLDSIGWSKNEVGDLGSGVVFIPHI